MRRLAQTAATGLGTLGLFSPAWAQERAWDWGWHPMWGMWGAWGLGMMLVEILRRRYARGEINKDKFDAKKRDLG